MHKFAYAALKLYDIFTEFPVTGTEQDMFMPYLIDYFRRCGTEIADDTKVHKFFRFPDGLQGKISFPVQFAGKLIRECFGKRILSAEFGYDDIL